MALLGVRLIDKVSWNLLVLGMALLVFLTVPARQIKNNGVETA